MACSFKWFFKFHCNSVHSFCWVIFLFIYHILGVEIYELRKEFREMLEHSVQFISLSTLGYQEVWSRLFHSPCAEQWSNILTLAELLFSLPASNGKLERCFSTLKLIKADRRCSLSNNTLDDLLILNTDRESLQDFNPGGSN